MSNGLYDALRAAGVDLHRAHLLDAYLRARGDATAAGLLRTLDGEPTDVEHVRTTLRDDLEAIAVVLALLDGMHSS